MADHNFPKVVAVGELLIDFISTNYANTLDEASSFVRLPGGSPANLAGNLARLGQPTGLVASVGKDDMGKYLLSFVQSLNLDTSGLRQVKVPTTLLLVTKSKEVSDFEAYRQADREINTDQLPLPVLQQLKVLHTTCFGLSEEPARSAILSAAVQVSTHGGQVSLDANYAGKIWPDQAEAQQIVATYCALGAMVKFSEVDWERLYGTPLDNEAEAAAFLHSLGAKIVCITLGEKGCFVSNGEEQYSIPTRAIEVVDTTGAGDAFWSGFLCAFLDGYGLKECALSGRRMAEIKLQHFGPLPPKVDKRVLYLDFAADTEGGAEAVY
jgi:sugar/nucleoside kinase (ribokinase family)